MPQVAIDASDLTFQAQSHALAQKLSLPLHSQAPESVFILRYGKEGLCLYRGVERLIHVDFSTGKAQHRQQFGGGIKQPLPRAVGLGKSATGHILDATAGLGQDAYVLATLGATVTMVEQSVVVYALLADAIERGQQDANSRDACLRMQLHHANSAAFIAQSDCTFDAIYMDPMYPQQGKKAAAKKGMQTLKDLLGADTMGDQILQAALQSGCPRIAVKRPKNAPWLGDIRPVGEIKSPNTRYDLYTSKPPTE